MGAVLKTVIMIQLFAIAGLVSADCDSPLGMESGQIPNSALKATTEYSAAYGPSNARLNLGIAWIAKASDKGQWIQVDFGKVVKVTKIGMQGRSNARQWVTKISVSYSIDGGFFEYQKHSPYTINREYIANKDNRNVVVITLDQPIIARYIRIHPMEWYGFLSMRMEFYGCRSGFPTPQPPVCMASLGLENYGIPDSSVKASSEVNAYYKASNGRLHLHRSGSVYGGWVARYSNSHAQQWFQVFFGNWAQVTAVSTQGRENADQWVTKYELWYSYDGVFFRAYKGDASRAMDFNGNKDRYTVVNHLLKYPIITRYIRIVPIAWYGAIALRADFYGCKSGFQPPTIECASPLGLENGIIPDSAIVASSRYNQYWGPERGRLNKKKDGSYNGGWVAQYNDDKQFLQVDLGNVTKVTRIALQGRDDAAWWVKTFSLSYSVDGGTFQEYNYGKVIQGNYDYVNAEGRILNTPIIARFIKINVKSSNGYPSMRMELYGCREGFPTPKPPQCMDALGMQSGYIPDSAISASSSYNGVSLSPLLGRLHLLSAGSGKYGSWAAASNDQNQFFQVDMGSWTKITAFETQGRQDADQWVVKCSLSFSYDGVFYETVNDEHGLKKIFNANFDRYTVVRNVLDKPIITRFIRIHPVEWNGHISMRTEFYGCRKGFDPPKIECAEDLGMESGEIPNSALTASSQYNQYWGPERCRLNTITSGSYGGGWVAKSADIGQWLKIDLGKITKITRLATQGRNDVNWWVKSYKLSYSDGGPYKLYKNGEVIQGNMDRNTAEGRILDEPIIARYLRIHPQTWQGHICLRIELFGCREGFTSGDKEECKSILGMQNNQIPDSAITASGYYSSLVPKHARLHYQGSSWSNTASDQYQYLQIDLGGWTKVTRVETQGRQNADWWTKLYKISFSYDGVFFELYQEKGVVKLFSGNTDRHTVVGHNLENPIIARTIRFHPVRWNGYMSLRVELYGCREGFVPPEIKCTTPLGVEDEQIPDSAMVASSEYNQYFAAERGRLRKMTLGGYYGGWAPSSSTEGQWLQIDLGKDSKVTGIATQGRFDADWWVTGFVVGYRVNGGSYLYYKNGEVLVGNLDRNTAVGNIFEPPIIARYVKILVKSWRSYICLRVELYGCREGFSTPKPPTCAAALGMQTNQISDSALSASTSYNINSMGAANGRLHFQAGNGKYGAWAVSKNDLLQWFEVDFGDWVEVTRVATQGRQDGDWWVKKYRLSFSYDGVFYQDYKEDGYVKVFIGNSDRYTVVTHVLKNSIITRKLRINPIEWHGYISLRAEFYGCREGFQKPQIVCRAALGVENGKIPETAFAASSQYNQYWKPVRARLRTVTEGNYGGCWASQYADMRQFLQIDLGKVTKVTAIATQGRDNANWWVTKYTLEYALDDRSFIPYGNGNVQEFTGNSDRNTAEGHILDPSIIARFVKIRVKSWSGHICMRVELFGCTEGFPTPKPPVCFEALGMQNGDIPDSAITSSTEYNLYAKPFFGRLHSLYMRGRLGAWIAQRNDMFQWLKVNLGAWRKIQAVGIQGRQEAEQWVKSFTLSYGYDDVFFQDYLEDGQKKFFEGNKDRYTVNIRRLKDPIIARYVRINPVEWQSHICLRAEFYGCREGFVPPVLECQSDLGMRSGSIPDRAITATTIYNEYYGPERARLDTTKQGSYGGAWLSKTNDLGQWIEVDLGKISKITRIATQGRSDVNNWVISYSISYSVNGGPFLPYRDGQALSGNKDRDTVVGHILEPAIIARYIRIQPQAWQGHIGLRFELFGCMDGFQIPDVPECQLQLGMQNGKIPNSALSASSQLNAYYGAENARLHFQGASKRHASWTPSQNNHQQWIQVDFGVDTQVTRIATQGNHAANYWTTSYTLRYKAGGFYFQQYQPNGVTKTFQGNKDRYTVVSHDLLPPIRTQYLRVVPESWNGRIALRLELYGCHINDGGYSKWSGWTKCSVSCGEGRKSRSRSCTNPPPSAGGKNCSEIGADVEFAKCNSGGCPVDGGYTKWERYSTCSKSCGGGKQSRRRTCTNPSPSNGGKDCSGQGPAFQSRKCNNKKCPVDGGYGPWGNWSDCSLSCGGGQQSRTRKCNNPEPKYGGKDCAALGKPRETGKCNDNGCPVDGGYTKWGSYGGCSESCGGGQQAKYRYCTNPVPSNGGADCSRLGKNKLTRECNNQYCPVDGGYGSWGNWSDCSLSCGGGQRSRTRQCNNPEPQYGGKNCSSLGKSRETEKCNDAACPVNGGYGLWGRWGQCSLTCGNKKGVKTRKRMCNNPVPQNGGLDCSMLGKDTDTKECTPTKTNCPVDGQWGPWTEWSDCSLRCGGGQQKQARQCNDPKPSGGGKNCAGGAVQTRECNTQECQAKWKPAGCYHNIDRALSELVLRAGNLGSIPRRYEACVDKANELGISLFGLDDKRCWTVADTTSSYSKYGTSGHCKTSKGYSGGLTSMGTMFVYEKDYAGNWEPIGCYVNVASKHALPKAFDTKVQGNASGSKAIFEYCKEKAELYGYTVFGVNDKACLSGDDPSNTYDMYGHSYICSVNAQTGNGFGREVNGDMFVYVFRK